MGMKDKFARMLGKSNRQSISELAAVVCGSGSSASRPSTASVGAMYYDTTINKPIWLKTAPSTWVDATGTGV